jgi:hypothetical protein
VAEVLAMLGEKEAAAILGMLTAEPISRVTTRADAGTAARDDAGVRASGCSPPSGVAFPGRSLGDVILGTACSAYAQDALSQGRVFLSADMLHAGASLTGVTTSDEARAMTGHGGLDILPVSSQAMRALMRKAAAEALSASEAEAEAEAEAEGREDPEAGEFDLHGDLAAALPALARRMPISCAVCSLPARSITSVCRLCGHGGHLAHMRQWFAEFDECPSGCGCACMAETEDLLLDSVPQEHQSRQQASPATVN